MSRIGAIVLTTLALVVAGPWSIIRDQAAQAQQTSGVAYVGPDGKTYYILGSGTGNSGVGTPSETREGEGLYVHGAEAQAISESLRNGRGWVFASESGTDANGGRYVKYQVVTGAETIVRNNDQVERLKLTVREETAWIYDADGSLPAADGPADQVFQAVDAQLNAHQSGNRPLHESTKGPLEQVRAQIQPLIRHPAPVVRLQPRNAQPVFTDTRVPNAPRTSAAGNDRSSEPDPAGVEAVEWYLKTMRMREPNNTNIDQGASPYDTQSTREPSPATTTRDPGLEAVELFFKAGPLK